MKIELPATGEVEGSVRDAKGRPVARVQVVLTDDIQHQNTSAARRRQLQLPRTSRTGEHRIAAGPRSGTTASGRPAPIDDDLQGEKVDVRAGGVAEARARRREPRSASITGVVRDADGGPVADAFVEADTRVHQRRSCHQQRMRTGRWGSSSTTRHLTDIDGRFAITGLADRQIHRPRPPQGRRRGDCRARRARRRPRPHDRRHRTHERHRHHARRRDPRGVHHHAHRRDDRLRTRRPLPSHRRAVELPGAARRQVQAARQRRARLGRDPGEHDRRPGHRRCTHRADAPGDRARRGRRPRRQAAHRHDGDHRGCRRLGRGDADRRNVTDAAGRYEVTHAPAGIVIVRVYSSNAGAGAYQGATLPAAITASGDAVELPPIRVPKRRTERGEVIGDLGHSLKQYEPGTDLLNRRLVVAAVRPGSPATQAGLKPGDEIVAVDGHDVRGPNAYLYETLTSVPVGTTIQLGLSGGASLAITAATPP